MSKQIQHYNDEFKQKIVELINSGKSYKSVISEYEIARSTVFKWVESFNKTKSFKAKDNRSSDENDLIKLKKEVAILRMENDILKQAALILGRK